MPVIEDLQQNVKYIRMRFFNLIKENNRIWIATHLLAELSALLVANISWRRTDHLGNAVFLHVLRHINADHRIFRAKHRLRECLGKLCFSDTRRPQEQKRTDRPLRILESHTTTADRTRHGGYSFLLSDHTLMQNGLQFQQPL